MDANTSTDEEEVVSNTPNNAPASTPPSRTTETADNVRPIATNSQQQYAFPASIDPAFAGGASFSSPQPFFYATPYSSIVAAQNQTNVPSLTDIVKGLEKRAQNDNQTSNNSTNTITPVKKATSNNPDPSMQQDGRENRYTQLVRQTENNKEQPASVFDIADEEPQEETQNATSIPIPPTQPTVTTKLEPQPTTTSRNKKRKRVKQMRKGVRVYIKRKDLMQICNTDAQRDSINPSFPNGTKFYGTVTGGNSTRGWNTQFDVLPIDDNIIKAVKRLRLYVLQPGEEEVVYDNTDDTHELEAPFVAVEKATTKSLEVQSEDEFISQQSLADVKVYTCKYKQDKNPITWRIKGEREYIRNDNEFDSIVEEMKKQQIYSDDIDFENKSIDEIFFEHTWPSMEGCSERIDKFHSNKKSPYFNTVRNENIKFNTDGDDRLLKQCILCIIAAATEVESGMNMWKAGNSGGRHCYPDFGKYVSGNTMRAFMAAFPFMWVEEKYWFVEKRDMPWDMFMPVINKWNESQRKLIKTFLCLIMDESMVGWRPKTSKLGGLPNYTWEPRKPIPLGTMFRNAAECVIGMVVNNDPCMCSELQNTKEYSNMQSLLFEDKTVPVHVAEVLRQVGQSGLKRGGWCGGDAWFGSVQAAISAKIVHNVHSSFIVKSNSTLFPMRPLLAVMKARYGERVAGKWVVFTSTVAGVKLIAVAYAWSMKGISYFISTCGNTNPSSVLYKSNFEDEFGGVGYKMIQRPKLAEFLYQFLPIIDEHNKQRQNLLNLEYKWPTKHCWVRLMVSLVGFSVTNLYRLYRNYDYETYKDMGVVAFSDLICSGLQVRTRSINRLPQPIQDANTPDKDKVERIVTAGGAMVKEKNTKRDGVVGSGVQQTCWICRFYENPKKPGRKLYSYTSWCCKVCKTPLCRELRCRALGAKMSCIDMHLRTGDGEMKCNGKKKTRQTSSTDLIR